MAIAEMILWWYTSGWGVFIRKLGGFLSSVTDFFSMDSLVRTLFKPFRQISAEAASEHASLGMKFHMFLDRLVSRIIGFFSRLILLITGMILIVLGGMLSLVLIILWPVLPLAPIAGVVLAAIGVVL